MKARALPLSQNGKPKKSRSCNCKKSKCLKLYCDCFSENNYCSPECNCSNCMNNSENDDERNKAISSTLDRNPTAFTKKIEVSFLKHLRSHLMLCRPMIRRTRRIRKGATVRRVIASRSTANAFNPVQSALNSASAMTAITWTRMPAEPGSR